MEKSLFRKEVLEARKARWLGGIALRQSMPLWLLTAAAAAAATAIVCLLVFGEYTRRTRVGGQLVPSAGLSSVVAPTAGALTEVRVREGQRVRTGDVLVVVDTPGFTLAGGDTTEALQTSISQRQESVANTYASQRLQLESQQAGLLAQIEGMRAESLQMDAELATRSLQHKLASETLERISRLREKQYVTDIQVQQQQAAVLEQLGAVQSLQRQGLALRRQLSQLEQALEEIPARLSALSAGEQRDRASLNQESVETSSRGEAVVRSPVSGTVSTLLAHSGQTVQPGRALLSLLPENSVLEAHLLVPSRAVGFIEPGDAVLLRYQAYPYQKFGHHGGSVVRISRSALTIEELGTVIGGVQASEPHYRIVVALDSPTVRAFGKEEPLKPGMVIEADILGERRKLWEWAVEPLYALSGSVGGAG